MFGLVSALLPGPVADKEFGAALKDIERRIADQRPAIEIRLKVGATVSWAVAHTLFYVLRRISKAVGIADLIKAVK